MASIFEGIQKLRTFFIEVRSELKKVKSSQVDL